MKYMITNGNEYIHILKPSKNMCDENLGYTAVDSLSYATRFKHTEAQAFLENRLVSSSKWEMRKIGKFNSGRNYVISTGTNYVTNTCTTKITTNFAKAKWFRSVADAEAYIAKHQHTLENPVIVDEDGNTIEFSSRKTFTDEQLAIIGKLDTEKSKRIIIPKTTRQKVYEQGNGICAICGKPVDIDKFTIDHIVPLSRGGSNELENLQIACEDCNRLKSNRMDSEFATGLTNILSHSLLETPNKSLSDILIRTIVRGQLNQMFGGTLYSGGK